MSTKVEQLLANKGRNVWSVNPDTTVQQAVALFGIHDVGAVLVCDEQGNLLGIVSERDCVRKVMWQARASSASRVCDVMTEVVAVSPRDSIEHCMTLMTERRTRHLPVVEHGEILGVISVGDVIHAMLHDKESLIESLEGYISGSPSVRRRRIDRRVGAAPVELGLAAAARVSALRARRAIRPGGARRSGLRAERRASRRAALARGPRGRRR